MDSSRENVPPGFPSKDTKPKWSGRSNGFLFGLWMKGPKTNIVTQTQWSGGFYSATLSPRATQLSRENCFKSGFASFREHTLMYIDFCTFAFVTTCFAFANQCVPGCITTTARTKAISTAKSSLFNLHRCFFLAQGSPYISGTSAWSVRPEPWRRKAMWERIEGWAAIWAGGKGWQMSYHKDIRWGTQVWWVTRASSCLQGRSCAIIDDV